MNRFRKLLVRFEKLTVSYKALLMFSCAFIALRKAGVIQGYALSRFRNVFETKSKETLSEYITTYKNCGFEPLKKNAESLEKDIVPVTNAVVEKYSNGFVEGTNNKLKVIKRVAYGRCKLPLLRSKIMLSAFFCP